MAGALIFSLAMAAIGLLVFGERMGLPAPLAALGVAGVLGAVLVVSAVSAATSRLGRFILGENGGAGMAQGAIVALLLVLARFYPGLFGAEVFSPALWLLTGFVLGQLLPPVNPWAAFRPAIQRSGSAEPSRAATLRGAAPAIMLAAGLGAATLLAAMVPVLADRLVEASGWPPRLAFRGVVAFICLLALVGGLVSIRRAAMIGLAFAGLLLVLPVVPEWLRIQSPQGLDVEFLRYVASETLNQTGARIGMVLRRPDLPAGVMGFALGMTALQASGAVRGTPARVIAIVTGLVTATTVLAIFEFNGTRLQALITTGLVEAAPTQWPVFVYDDVLRGWLSACGTWPDDARQAARACGAVDPRLPLAPGSLRFDNGLAMPALAAASGLPVILGFLWALLPLVIVLVACAMLLLVAATGLAELLALGSDVRPALRSARLARIRLIVLGLSTLLLTAGEVGFRLDARLIRWAMLGVALLGLSAMVAGWIVRFMRAIRNRRDARAIPEPEAETVKVGSYAG